MMRAVYAVFLIFIISFVIFPQEVIKEKVEIAPTVKNNKKVLGAQDHTLSIEFNWNLPERQGLVDVSYCGDWREDATRLSTGGTITESINAPSGSYSIPCHAMINTGEECISTLKVYLDGNLVVDVQGGSDIEGSFETPYYDYFEAWYSDPVSYGSNISPITIHTGKCTSTPLPYYFDDNDNMSISIVSGKEYALLAGDYNYSNLSDSVSFPIGNMPVIELDYFNPNLTTNNIDVIFQAYVNGNSKQYSVTIPPAQFSLYTYQYDDVVYHNATTSTYINFREESNTSAPSGSLTLSASIIRGSKYGVLVNPMTGDKGASLENIATSGGSLILNFEATGENPSIADTVIMHLVPSSASIAPVDIQWVIAPSPIDVTLVPDVLSPGDTANVVIKRKNIDGSTEDFPSDQEFEVSITGGCDGGELLVGDSLANYFSGVTQPVKFVASQSFTSDSIALQIRVGSNIGGGIASSIVKGKNKNAKAVSSALNKKKENYEKLLAEKIKATQKQKTADAGSCYAGEYRTNTSGTGKGALKSGPELEIIYPTATSLPEKITDEPKMPVVTCQARLNNYNKGTVTFEWEYCVSYKLQRHDKDNGKYVPLATRDAEIRFSGSSTANNSNITNWVVPFDKDHISYLKFKAQWPQRNNKYHDKHYGGDTTKVITSWPDGFNVFIGGYVFVQVTAKSSDGNIIGFKQESVNKILGDKQQLDVNTIYNYAGSNEVKALLIQEAKTKQFAIDNTNWPQYEAGWPLYGYPNGYGLMQLDNNPAPTENQLWNWKANLDGGKDKFSIFYNNSIKKVKIHKKSNIDVNKVALINAYHHYNNGTKVDYYLWDDIRQWYENPGKRNNYGIEAYNKYLKLIQ